MKSQDQNTKDKAHGLGLESHPKSSGQMIPPPPFSLDTTPLPENSCRPEEKSNPIQAFSFKGLLGKYDRKDEKKKETGGIREAFQVVKGIASIVENKVEEFERDRVAINESEGLPYLQSSDDVAEAIKKEIYGYGPLSIYARDPLLILSQLKNRSKEFINDVQVKYQSLVGHTLEEDLRAVSDNETFKDILPLLVDSMDIKERIRYHVHHRGFFKYEREDAMLHHVQEATPEELTWLRKDNEILSLLKKSLGPKDLYEARKLISQADGASPLMYTAAKEYLGSQIVLGLTKALRILSDLEPTTRTEFIKKEWPVFKLMGGYKPIPDMVSPESPAQGVLDSLNLSEAEYLTHRVENATGLIDKKKEMGRIATDTKKAFDREAWLKETLERNEEEKRTLLSEDTRKAYLTELKDLGEISELLELPYKKTNDSEEALACEPDRYVGNGKLGRDSFLGKFVRNSKPDETKALLETMGIEKKDQAKVRIAHSFGIFGPKKKRLFTTFDGMSKEDIEEILEDPIIKERIEKGLGEKATKQFELLTDSEKGDIEYEMILYKIKSRIIKKKEFIEFIANLKPWHSQKLGGEEEYQDRIKLLFPHQVERDFVEEVRIAGEIPFEKGLDYALQGLYGDTFEPEIANYDLQGVPKYLPIPFPIVPFMSIKVDSIPGNLGFGPHSQDPTRSFIDPKPKVKKGIITHLVQNLSADERAELRLGYHYSRTKNADEIALLPEEEKKAVEKFKSIETQLDDRLGPDDMHDFLDQIIGIATDEEFASEEARIRAIKIIDLRAAEKGATQDKAKVMRILTSKADIVDWEEAELNAVVDRIMEDGMVNDFELFMGTNQYGEFSKYYDEYVEKADQITGLVSTVAGAVAGFITTLATGGALGIWWATILGGVATFGGSAVSSEIVGRGHYATEDFNKTVDEAVIGTVIEFVLPFVGSKVMKEIFKGGSSLTLKKIADSLKKEFFEALEEFLIMEGIYTRFTKEDVMLLIGEKVVATVAAGKIVKKAEELDPNIFNSKYETLWYQQIKEQVGQ